MNHVRYEEGLAWCAESLDSTFYFKDIEHATINNFHGERVVCRNCVEAIVSAIKAVPEVALLTDAAHNSTIENYGGTT